MARPYRQLADPTVRELRRDYRLRKQAIEMIKLGRAILDKTPSCGNWARSLKVSSRAVLDASAERTYQYVADEGEA